MAKSQKKDTKKAQKKSGLGKGLSALISSDGPNLATKGYIPNLSIDQISPNPHQPRMVIDPEELIELSDSIRENGIIQPLIVTKRGEKDYTIVAGERRWRAAQLANVNKIPVVVKDVSPQQMLELAVIENVQRQDLNPIEEALAFDQLREKFNLSASKIGKKVGLSRSAVVNKIRLLKLPEKVKQVVLDGILSEGHARALLGIPDADSITATADVVIKKGLSVHDTEDLVRKIVQGEDASIPRSQKLSDRAEEIQKHMKKRLGLQLSITNLKSGGKITIKYRNKNELEDLYRTIMGKED